MAATAYANSNQAGTATMAPPFPSLPEGHKPAVPDRDRCRLKKQLDPILKGIRSPATEEAVRHVFNTLSRLREIMGLVELNVGEGGPARVTLAAFAGGENKICQVAFARDARRHELRHQA